MRDFEDLNFQFPSSLADVPNNNIRPKEQKAEFNLTPISAKSDFGESKNKICDQLIAEELHPRVAQGLIHKISEIPQIMKKIAVRDFCKAQIIKLTY